MLGGNAGFCVESREAKTTRSTTPALMYGANPAVGRTFTHDGITFYYEVYGPVNPVLGRDA